MAQEHSGRLTARLGAPAVRRLQLAREARAWRDRAGLTLEQSAADLDLSTSALGRMEKAQSAIHPLHARAMIELYRIPEDDACRFVEIAREARQRNTNLMEGISVNSFAALEAEAVGVRNYQLIYVPGLLQTEDYARAMFELDSPRERERNLALRLNRRERLFGEDPLHLHAIIDEPALTRPVLHPRAHAAQLHHVVEMSALPNVVVQVIPASKPVHPGLRGTFTVLSFPADTIEDMAYVEYAGGNLQLVKTNEVAALAAQFTKLGTIAASEHESRDLIIGRAAELN